MILRPWTVIPKKLKNFIGWDNDSETLQRPHTLRHSVPRSSFVLHCGQSRKQFWGLKLWTESTLSTPYSWPTSETSRVQKKSKADTSHPVTKNPNLSETFRPEHIPQTALAIHTLGTHNPLRAQAIHLGASVASTSAISSPWDSSHLNSSEDMTQIPKHCRGLTLWNPNPWTADSTQLHRWLNRSQSLETEQRSETSYH